MLRKEQTEEFIKEFLFFFSLLKRKKEAKKKSSSPTPYFERQCITRLAVQSDYTQQKSPGGVVGSLSAVTLPVLNVKLGRKVSGDPPQLPTEFVAFDKKEILLYNKTITFFCNCGDNKGELL